MNPLRTFVLPVALVSVWALSAALHLVPYIFLPPPAEVATLLYLELLVSGSLWPDLLATFVRTLLGFLIGGALGVTLGLLLGFFPKLYASLEFSIDFFRSVPATALFPLFLLFFGIGDEAKMAVSVWVCSLVVLVNTTYGIRHASKTRLKAAQAFSPTKLKLFTDVIVFEAAPHVASALRTALSLSLVVIVVTEMFIGTTVGLGHRIIDAQLVYGSAEMYAAILLTGFLGYALNQLFLYAEKSLLHWSSKQ